VKLPSLNPHKVRARLFGAPKGQANKNSADAGFTLIEIMGTIGIVAVLALAAVPQLNKAMEKANVQNLISDINNLAIQIEGDQSLVGGGLYTLVNVKASCTALTNLTAGNILKVAPNATGTGYIITGYNPNVRSYSVTYDSLGAGATVAKVATPVAAFTACS
jgi:prepilin-type N-terminal cleavage/methylation domain-containing protein